MILNHLLKYGVTHLSLLAKLLLEYVDLTTTCATCSTNDGFYNYREGDQAALQYRADDADGACAHALFVANDKHV